MPDYFSYSQLNSYLTCPLKYRFRYLDQVGNASVPSSLVFGSCIHQVLASFYREVMERKPYNQKKLIEEFVHIWKEAQEEQEITYREKEGFEDLLEKGKEMLKVFCRSVPVPKVIAVEESFRIDLEHPDTKEILALPLVGVIDLILEDEQGRIIVVDHKTSSRKYSDLQLSQDLQLTAYAMAASQLGLAKGKEVLVRLDVLTKKGKPTFTSHYALRDKKDFAKLVQITEQVLEAIRERIFYPNYGPLCPYCPYLDECREW